ncbi:kinase [Stenotrophomonas sp. Marseille-Q4652]|uniref:kinase n=1 Tax=Stenotrophomonas sp. Marseille-Q4652 TaxID=2866595 RepID=UPI001CE3C6D4|nr:kinase [Stenotrophomonas sp. Marseille-Q4652]
MSPRPHAPPASGFPIVIVEAALADALDGGNRPAVLAISGLQGSGKSTLAARVVALARRRGLQAATLSIDDLYLTAAQRRHLAATVHPLLATRGPPGTHDIPLALSVFDAVRAGRRLRLPRFDKLADDRLPESGWTSVVAPLDLLVFEGWFLGTPAQAPGALVEPINELERVDDGDGRWRRGCNDALARDYPALWAQWDRLWFLQPPDFDVVVQWRWQQEQALRKSAARPGGMDRQQVGRFVQHFERVSRQALRTLPGLADRVVPLDARRQVPGQVNDT